MYAETRTIELSDCDFRSQLRPEFIFTRFDEIAINDAYKTKIMNDEMIHHYGWVVAKQTLKLKEPICYKDRITFTTDLRKPSAAIFPRYYTLIKNERIVGVNYSEWTFLDLAKRRIIRPKAVGIEMTIEEPMAEKPKTLRSDQRAVKAASCQAKYSDVDFNGHMNNTRYIRHACDMLPLDFYQTHQLQEISINYKKEILPESTFDIYTYQHDDIFHVEGRIGTTTHFIIEMIWQEIK